MNVEEEEKKTRKTIRIEQLAAIELSQLSTVRNKIKHQHLIHAFRPYVDRRPNIFRALSAIIAFMLCTSYE